MNRPQNDARRPYVRSMDGWWRTNPFFVRYMAREATALVVAAYAIVLLIGLLCLANGEAAYNRWLEVLSHPISVVLHVMALAAMVYHAWSWFDIMPKTMPPLLIGGKRVADEAITRTGLVVAAAAAVVLFLLVWSLKP